MRSGEWDRLLLKLGKQVSLFLRPQWFVGSATCPDYETLGKCFLYLRPIQVDRREGICATKGTKRKYFDPQFSKWKPEVITRSVLCGDCQSESCPLLGGTSAEAKACLFKTLWRLLVGYQTSHPGVMDSRSQRVNIYQEHLLLNSKLKKIYIFSW